MIEIPLTSAPEQLLTVTIRGNTYDCRVKINSRSGVWSISFSQFGVDIVNGVPLLAGIDILKQHNLPIDNAYVVNLDDPKLDPSSDNLGVSSKLFILTDEEVSGG